jgi:quercetin dioxygenase-like cupin family protein
MPGSVQEADLVRRFAEEGLSPQRWSSGPGDAYAIHRHPYHKVLYVVAGSIDFTLRPSGEVRRLRPGDRLDLPPQTEHSALVGPNGVTCLEAARPASIGREEARDDESRGGGGSTDFSRSGRGLLGDCPPTD